MLAIAAGIRDLDQLKEATATLADPRRTKQRVYNWYATARPIYFNAG